MIIAPKWLKLWSVDFKFDMRVQGTVWTLPLNFSKRVWPGSRDPVNFWVLNANGSNSLDGYMHCHERLLVLLVSMASVSYRC